MFIRQKQWLSKLSVLFVILSTTFDGVAAEDPALSEGLQRFLTALRKRVTIPAGLSLEELGRRQYNIDLGKGRAAEVVRRTAEVGGDRGHAVFLGLFDLATQEEGRLGRLLRTYWCGHDFAPEDEIMAYVQHHSPILTTAIWGGKLFPLAGVAGAFLSSINDIIGNNDIVEN